MLTRFEEVQIRIQNKTQGFFLFFGACNGLPVTFIIFRRLPLLYSTRDHPCGMASVNYSFCNSWIYSFPHHRLQYPSIWRQCYNQTCTTPITGDYDMFRWTLRALLCNASNDTYNFYSTVSLIKLCEGEGAQCVRWWPGFQEKIVMRKEKGV